MGRADILSGEGEEQVRNFLDKMDIFKEAELDKTYPTVLKEMDEITAGPLVIFFENL